jgi:hypothetical protein
MFLQGPWLSVCPHPLAPPPLPGLPFAILGGGNLIEMSFFALHE